MKQFLALAFSLLTAQAWAGAEVCIDHGKGTVTVSAHYYFYGSQAKAHAKPCADEIFTMWNNDTKILLNKVGTWKKVNFTLTYKVISYDSAKIIANDNESPKINFARIDNPPPGSRVDVSEHDIADNSGYFIPANGLGNSTTCAHEFGHGLGLTHPPKNKAGDYDLRGQGVPIIMAPRGSLVDAPYQYDPKAKAGEKGGTINPTKRKVSHKEIAKLEMGDLDYEWISKTVECAPLGKARNRIYNRRGDEAPRFPTFYNQYVPGDE